MSFPHLRTILLLLLASAQTAAQTTMQTPDAQAAFLKQLARYETAPATAPLHAEVRLKTRLENGKSEAQQLREGEVQLTLRDGPQGMALSYPAELMRLVMRERDQAMQEPDGLNPTLTAFNEIDTSVLRDMTDAAATLKRQVDNAVFLGAENGGCPSTTCSILRYSFGEERLSRSSKRFVKEFDGRLDITVDATGRPLRAKLTQRARGRAFVFLRFRSDVDEIWDFAESGERLIALRHTRRRESAGGGERGMRWHDYRVDVEGLEAPAWMACAGREDPDNNADTPDAAVTAAESVC